ncbi:MAG: leucine-rich repeat protein, partial [Parasporobacterium sp.]|nr:leucine-rich repeat protein [Parasporobacterium sp.]
MKKIVSLLLAISLILMCCVISSAEEQEVYSENIVNVQESSTEELHYTDDTVETATEEIVFAPNEKETFNDYVQEEITVSESEEVTAEGIETEETDLEEAVVAEPESTENITVENVDTVEVSTGSYEEKPEEETAASEEEAELDSVSGTSGNIRWSLDDYGTLTISGTGTMPSYGSDIADPSAPWYSRRSSVKKVVIQNGVTSISRSAFEGCSNMTSISIPSSVTEIGRGCLRNCSSLASITIPAGATFGTNPFSGCSSLRTVVWGSRTISGIEFGTYGPYAIGARDSSGKVTIYGSGSITYGGAQDGTGIFSSQIKNIVFSEGITEISSSFCFCVNSQSVVSVTIPISLKTIGSNAFNYCSGLKDVYYNGSSTDWSKISIGSGNTYLLSASRHYTSASGFAYKNGKWGWYVNGVLQTGMTGIIKGTIDGKTAWYYIVNGVYTKSTGLVKRADGKSGWYYITNGKFNTSATGITKRVDGVGGWYFVKDGVYTKVNGIAQKADGSSSTWYYVQNGEYVKATGIAKKADGSSNAWYYVEDGKYIKSTGLVKRADGEGGWYYITNGKYNTSATGITKRVDGVGGWYYVKKGVYTKATGIFRKADGSSTTEYYVENGVFKAYTGSKVFNEIRYQLNKGVVTSATADYAAAYADYLNSNVSSGNFTFA